MSDWMNWQDFSAAHKTENQRQADENEMMQRAQSEQIDKALAGLGDAAGGLAREGRFSNVSQLNGYSQLMASRDAALKSQQSPLAAAPWEADLQGPSKPQPSPWADLQKRLGAMNNKYAQANTVAVNQQAHDKQRADEAAFRKAQEQKLKDANAGKDKATQDYIAWSDSVKYNGQNNGGAGAGAYYDARDGSGPQPVQQPWGQSPRVQGMQTKLDDINQNQIMPRTNRGFGTQGPGSNGWW